MVFEKGTLGGGTSTSSARNGLCDLEDFHLAPLCVADPRDSHQTLGGECGPEVECPKMCRCDGTTVDCSGQGLTSVPDNIPPYASEL